MTTCLGKSCSFSLPCAFIVNVFFFNFFLYVCWGGGGVDGGFVVFDCIISF